MTLTLELLSFVFSSFWTWLGTFFLIWAVAVAVPKSVIHVSLMPRGLAERLIEMAADLEALRAERRKLKDQKTPTNPHTE